MNYHPPLIGLQYLVNGKAQKLDYFRLQEYENNYLALNSSTYWAKLFKREAQHSSVQNLKTFWSILTTLETRMTWLFLYTSTPVFESNNNLNMLGLMKNLGLEKSEFTIVD